MAGADDPTRRLPGVVVLAGLALIGLLGLVVLVVGLGGAFGPSPTPEPSATAASGPSTRPSPLASFGPSASATSGPSAGPSAFASSDPGATAPSSAPPSALPAEDPLLAGLLQEADLPGLSSPLGPQEGSDSFDIDDRAFVANHGIRVVSRAWQSLADTGLAGVFDFRMQFPTEAAAAAYLDAAEPILSEAAANGQVPVASPPVIGQDSRVYGLETTGDGGPVLLRTYLFRVGPVVAKLVAAGPGVGPGTTDALARAAADRISTAGPLVPGSPRPAATTSPKPTRSVPMPTGEALAALLLEHVPPAIVAGCVPDAQRLWPGELATVVCTDDEEGVTVTYSGFQGADAVEAAIDSSLEGVDASALAPSCDLGTFVGPYEVEGEEVGRVVCWAEEGGQAIMWSDDRLAILAVAASPTLDAAGLYLWWLGAGPIP